MAIQGHSRSSVDITPSLHIHTPPLFQVELEKMAGSRWKCFGVRVPRTLDYPTINFNWRVFVFLVNDVIV